MGFGIHFTVNNEQIKENEVRDKDNPCLWFCNTMNVRRIPAKCVKFEKPLRFPQQTWFWWIIIFCWVDRNTNWNIVFLYLKVGGTYNGPNCHQNHNRLGPHLGVLVSGHPLISPVLIDRSIYPLCVVSIPNRFNFSIRCLLFSFVRSLCCVAERALHRSHSHFIIYDSTLIHLYLWLVVITVQSGVRTH